MAQEATSDAATGALRALAPISSSPPARTGVSGLNDPTRTLEYIDTKHPPSHFRACQGDGVQRLRSGGLAPSRERPAPGFASSLLRGPNHHHLERTKRRDLHQ